jgi:hypothetical protein
MPPNSMPDFDNLSLEELEELRRFIEDTDQIDAIRPEARKLVEKHWPWLLPKLPPLEEQ